MLRKGTQARATARLSLRLRPRITPRSLRLRTNSGWAAAAPSDHPRLIGLPQRSS
jgi:hypothetical protein